MLRAFQFIMVIINIDESTSGNRLNPKHDECHDLRNNFMRALQMKSMLHFTIQKKIIHASIITTLAKKNK